MIRRSFAVFGKELRLLARDPQLLFMQLVAPAAVLIVFGALFTITLRKVSVAVIDRDHTDASRQATRDLRSSPYFATSLTERPPQAALDTGDDMAVVEIPPGYGKRGRRGASAVQVLIDGTDAAAAAAQGYLESYTASLGAKDEPQLRAATDPLTAITWFNPDRADPNFFLPGIVALLLFCGPAIYCATAMVREKVYGTWGNLTASPIGDWSLIFGKLAPYALQGVFQAVALFAIAFYVFKVPLHGSLGLLAIGSALFTLNSTALGGLFAAVSSTEGEAWRLLQLLLMLPGLVLSGFIYPISSMPRVPQILSNIFPVRSYLELVRAVILKGADLDAVRPQLTTLVAFSAGCLLLAVLAIRRSRRLS
jgi:ABC-2 type transport system permease protein